MSVSVSIIIPVFNRLEDTRRCLHCVLDTGKKWSYEVVVIDNNSSDGSRAFLERFQRRHRDTRISIIRNDDNLGFAKACNQGAERAKGRFLIFLNNDTIPLPGWIEGLLTVLDSHEKNGIAGAKLLYPNGTIQHAGIAIADSPAPITPLHVWRERPRDFPPVQKQREFQAVTGACLAIRKALFHEVGGFDERFMNDCEDVDLCFRVREKGFRVVYAPASEVIHLESQSEGRYLNSDQNLIFLNAKWKNRIRSDFSKEDPRVGIILVDYLGSDDTIECLASLFGNNEDLFYGCGLFYKNFNVIVVENGTDPRHGDRIYQWCLKNHVPCRLETSRGGFDGPWRFSAKEVIILRPGENLGFAGGCNLGIRYALNRGAHYTWLLNNDAVVHPLSLWHLVWVATMAEKKALKPGIIGSMVRCFDQPGRVQFDGCRVCYGGYEEVENVQTGKLKLASFVSGASMLVPRKAWEDAGLMDEDFFLYYEDNELCARFLDRDFRIFYQPRSIIYHKGGNSIGSWLHSDTSVFYATRNYLIFHEKRNLVDFACWMRLKMAVWDGMVKSRENVSAFCDGLVDFIFGGKGPRRRALHARDTSCWPSDAFTKQLDAFQRFVSRVQDREPRDSMAETLLHATYEFYSAWKTRLLATHLLYEKDVH